MAKTYKDIENAVSVQYVTNDGTFKKIKLQAINGVNISNSFNIPYVRGTVGLFNAIISRFMFFGVFDAKGKPRAYPVAQEKIFFPAHQAAPMINRCESQVFNIIRSIERTLDIHVSRAHAKAGANVFRLSERAIEFLYIFKYQDLIKFIEKYDIEESDQYALKQMYNYRVVRPSDGNLNHDQRDEFYSFMKDRRHRDFVHFCSQNNKTPEVRVTEIEAHIDVLSLKQQEQLARIKQILKATPGKLKHYFHWLLIKLQQFITFMADKANIINKTNAKPNKTVSQVVNRNKTEGEQRTTEEVASVHKKEPNVHKSNNATLQDVVEVAVLWNIMSAGKDMDQLHTLTDKRIQSITNLVKSHEKGAVLTAIRNTNNMTQGEGMQSLVQFKDFLKDSTDDNSRFNKILNYNTPNSNLSNRDNMNRGNKLFKFNSIQVPEFKTSTEAKYWFKDNSNIM